MRMTWRLTLQIATMLVMLVIGELLLSLFFTLFSNETALANPSLELSTSSPQMVLVSILVRGLIISLSILLAGRLFDRRPFSDFGFRLSAGWWADFWFGISLGAILMTVIFLVELAAGWILPVGYFITNDPDLPFLAALFIPLLMFIIVGFYEELLSRGYHLTNLAEGLSGKYLKPQAAIFLACLVSSVLFGLLHAANPNATFISTLNISLAGIFLATGYILTGELAIPIGLHITWNFFQGNIFGFPVSGADFKLASLIQIEQLGPEWLTGGAFGPEGGLLGLLTNLLGILLIILWVKRRTGKLKLHTSISKPPSTRPNTKSENGQTSVSPPDIFQGIQHIIWDWNGTLLDDLDLCLTTINAMLSNRNMKPVSRSTYLDIFSFPVIDYYRKLGFDFSKEPFEKVSTEFIDAYETGRPGCYLMDGSANMLKQIHASGKDQSILSASKKSYLDQAMLDYKLQDYFTLVSGLADHHAAGKLSLARDHLSKIEVSPTSILVIGDTLHDAHIASELGLRCCLIPNGHHSKQRLEKSSATIIHSLTDLGEIYLSQNGNSPRI